MRRASFNKVQAALANLNYAPRNQVQEAMADVDRQIKKAEKKIERLRHDYSRLYSRYEALTPRIWEDEARLNAIIASGTSEELLYAANEIRKQPDWTDNAAMFDAFLKLDKRIDELAGQGADNLP